MMEGAKEKKKEEHQQRVERPVAVISAVRCRRQKSIGRYYCMGGRQGTAKDTLVSQDCSSSIIEYNHIYAKDPINSVVKFLQTLSDRLF